MSEPSDETGEQQWGGVWGLVEAHHADLRAYLPDRADVVHDFWLERGPALARNIAELGIDDPGAQKGFVLVALRWYVKDRFRRDAARKALMQRYSREVSLVHASAAPREAESVGALYRIVSSLGEDDRALFASIVSEVPVAKLAERHGVSLATMYRRRSELLGVIKERLEVEDEEG